MTPRQESSGSEGVLSDDDWSTLLRAMDLRRRHDAGIFPRGGGQHAHFRKLERMGLIEFDTWGRDLDREIEADVPIYKLTDKAIAILTRPEAESGGGR